MVLAGTKNADAPLKAKTTPEEDWRSSNLGSAGGFKKGGSQEDAAGGSC
jgi:uncharacterized protein YaaQ